MTVGEAMDALFLGDENKDYSEAIEYADRAAEIH